METKDTCDHKASALLLSAATVLLMAFPVWSIPETGQRTVLSLDGVWNIAQGTMHSLPTAFEHRVPVPGLVDMALPAFADVGRLSDERQAFWYKRRFVVKGAVPDMAILKVHKAKYGLQVWLNGQNIGEHLPCFTPALLDAKGALKGDEEGLLIQDEFPIWYLGEFPAALKSEVIAAQYRDWLQERWNHACVVIWDAQNESVTEETGKAIAAVRELDLSGRPWDNGWAAAQAEGDCLEAHPYLWIRNWFGGEPFQLSDLANTSPTPGVRDVQKEHQLPIINNEYAWLWLNRDGTPTCLTRAVYDDLIGPKASIPEHRYTYARYLAALTEFGRCHRKCAAVMHFCGLAYSRPGGWERPEAGATSDHFVDLESLNLEPFFVQFVRDAFAPVGLMIDLWQRDWSPGQITEVPVKAINDLYESWQGQVVLRLSRNGRTLTEQSRPCTLAPLGELTVPFELTLPEQPGDYLLTAELAAQDQDPVRSLRDIWVVTSED